VNYAGNYDWYCFLQGVSVAASPVLAIIGMSVSLSDTRWNCVKTTQARITKSSTSDSPNTSFRDKKIRPEIRKGSPGARALNEGGRENSQSSANNSPYLRNGAI